MWDRPRWARRYEDLESELELAVKHMRRSEDEHHVEITRLEGEVTRGIQDRHKLMEKLEHIIVVENAVKDLYLHMKVCATKLRQR